MSEGRYSVRPNADQDLEDQAYYYANRQSRGWPSFSRRGPRDVSRFGLRSRTWDGTRGCEGVNSALRLFRVRGFERMLILYLPLPDGVEILRVIHGSRDVETLLRREGLGIEGRSTAHRSSALATSLDESLHKIPKNAWRNKGSENSPNKKRHRHMLQNHSATVKKERRLTSSPKVYQTHEEGSPH